MASTVKNVLKSRASLATDIDLDRDDVRPRAALAKTRCAATEPMLQRILVHRSWLLTLMAAAYVLVIADNAWIISNEFETYDSIVRCPNLPEPDFLTQELEPNSYYTGWWEECGKTTKGKQYRVTDENGTRAVGSTCYWSSGEGDSFLLAPLANIAKSTATDARNFTNSNLDKINATTSSFTGVYIRIDPSIGFDNYTIGVSQVIFPAWRNAYVANNSFVPKCEDQHVSLPSGYGFSTFSVFGANYEVRCFTSIDVDEGESIDSWYYWQSGQANDDADEFDADEFDADEFNADEFDDDSIVFVTEPSGSWTGDSECFPIPLLERSCCTSQEVLISAKNSPRLIKTRKAIAVVKIVLNALSAACALIAAYRWTDLRTSRRFAMYAWLAPFVTASILAMLPFATLANLQSAQTYDDSLVKGLDDADIDGLVKYFNILMPIEAEYLVETLQYFTEENRFIGREISDLAMQIEFRLKAMTGTLFPLALSALALPGAVTKACIQVKEMFPSSAWIGWLIRLMPIFYLPWAAAIFCSFCQIFSGPFVTASVACFLTMKVVALTYNPSVHTSSYATHKEYRAARKPSFGVSVLLQTLLVATVGFFIAALFTDKYLKQIGIKSLVGEIDPEDMGPETAHFVFTFIIGFLSKSSNSIVMFTDLLLAIVAFIAAFPSSEEDHQVALALQQMLSRPDDAAVVVP